MAKSQLFKPPMPWIFTHGGVFPVRRGYARRGGVPDRQLGARPRRRDRHVLRGRPLAHGRAVEKPKRGIGRLALESGAPVVPVAIHGSSHVRNWKRGQFPKVDVAYGDLIPGPHRGADARAAAGRRRRDLRARQDALPRPGPLNQRSRRSMVAGEVVVDLLVGVARMTTRSRIASSASRDAVVDEGERASTCDAPARRSRRRGGGRARRSRRRAAGRGLR